MFYSVMERIGICQVDPYTRGSKRRCIVWPNLALAKIATHHLRRGDHVEMFSPLMPYDVIYASKVWKDTPDSDYLPDSAIRGGTGWGMNNTLPPEIEDLRPDFFLWPHWGRSLGFTTRGCIRKCSYCVVPEKEGMLSIVGDLLDVWDGKSADVFLMDNNITAAPIGHFRTVAQQAIDNHVKIDFTSGMDARLWTAEHQEVSTWLPYRGSTRFAFDHMAEESAVMRLIDMWTNSGMHPGRLFFYVLVGYDTTRDEDLYRINLLAERGCVPYVMAYDRTDFYQRRLRLWCNSIRYRAVATFAEYEARRGPFRI